MKKLLMMALLFFSFASAVDDNTTLEDDRRGLDSEALTESFSSVMKSAEEEVEETSTPKSSSYSEYFMMYELRNLRSDLERFRADIFSDMEHTKADVKKNVTQVEQAINKTQRETISSSVDLMTNFFYFVTIVLSILALAGWRTLNELKSSARKIVEKEVEKLIGEFEDRLEKIENDVREKGEDIIANQKKLENVQKLHTLWSHAAREKDDAKKIETLEEILEIESEDEDALVMRASSYLRLDLPEQAIESCNMALEISQNNSKALYNRACGHAQLEDEEKMYTDLHHALSFDVGLKEKIDQDRDFAPYLKKKEFKTLLAEF